jgi:WD40-like Beta Propeller Repeat.
MRSDGTAQHFAYSYDSGGGDAPTWSPDGTKLAFLRFDTYTPGALQPLYDIRILDLGSGHAMTLPLKVETDSNAPQWVTNRTLLVNRYG